MTIDDDRFLDSLKKNNLRITEARKAVYSVLADSDKSISVQGVFAKIESTSGIKTDRVSVYRNLNLFSKLGLVHRLQDGKYSICAHKHDADHGHDHLHIMAICNRCDSTFEVDSHDKQICQAVNKMKSFVNSFGSFSNITFQGTCNDCR